VGRLAGFHNGLGARKTQRRGDYLILQKEEPSGELLSLAEPDMKSFPINWTKR
jgi:hypothetical protein